MVLINVCCLQPFRKLPEHFPGFFQQMLEACLMSEPTVSLREQTALLVFLNHCFNSMEVELIRDQVKRLVSLSMWVSLQQVILNLLNVDSRVEFSEQAALLVFLNHCFNSMEVELIRDQVKRLVSLSKWVSFQQVIINLLNFDS